MKNVNSVRSKFLLLLAVMLFCALPMSASAAILTVGTACGYSTIQSAIDAASNGDTIIVYPDTYVEKINYLGKSIEVKSLMGAADTIIDSNHTGDTVTMSVSAGSVATLEGFTVTGAGDYYDPDRAIYIDSHSVQSSSQLIKNCIISGNANGIMVYGNQLVDNITNIEDCVITNNTCMSLITGIYGYYAGTLNVINCEISGNSGYASSPVSIYRSNMILFENCDVYNNYSEIGTTGIGVGQNISGGSVIINNCTIRNNTIVTIATQTGKGAGIYINRSSCDVQINNCIIADNSITGPNAKGTGIYVMQTIYDLPFELNVNSSTIANNYCSASISYPYQKTGGIYIEQLGSTLTVDVDNSILYGNTIGSSVARQINTGGATVTVNYTDIQDGWTGAGTGNIDSDPLFVGSGDYHLTGSSPCIDVGDTTLDVDFEATSRPRGSADDMGADEY